MKKLSLLIGGLLFSGLMMAQTGEQKGRITIEGQTNVGGVVIGEKLAPSFRFRYFVTEQIGLRGTFAIKNTTRQDTYYELPENTGNTGTYTEKSNLWNFAIGAEYHLMGNEKLSPFFALDINYGGGKRIIDAQNASIDKFTADYSKDAELPIKRIGIAPMGGLDYNFSPSFFLGGEIGVLISSTTVGAGSATITSSGIVTNASTKIIKYNSASDLIAAVRLGFRF